MTRIACSFPFGGASLPAVLIVSRESASSPALRFVSLDVPDLGVAAQRPAVRKLIVEWGRNYAAIHIAEIEAARIAEKAK